MNVPNFSEPKFSEQAVLGALILDNSSIKKLNGSLTTQDFCFEPHIVLFREISELLANNRPVDIITLESHLKTKSLLDKAGGESYIYELANNTPSAANISSYARVVKKHSELRRLDVITKNLSKKLSQSDANPRKIILNLQNQLLAIDQKCLTGKGLEVISYDKLINYPFKPKESILEPWLSTQSLNIVYAPRGVGKTHFSLGMAYAIASGGKFLYWKATKPQGVLFVDGEMPGHALQERVKNIFDSSQLKPMAPLKFITPDIQEFGIPDLATKEGQELIGAHISDEIELIILDNLSCLIKSGKENESESWQPIQDWLLRLRSQGKSVLFIHHAGKSGDQRGTSRREDVVDCSIQLCRPKDYSPIEGACFEVHFKKARHLLGEQTKPFTAKLETDLHGLQTWTLQTLEESNFQKVAGLLNDGLTQKDIAAELGVSKSTVSRHIKKAKEKGLIKQQEED